MYCFGKTRRLLKKSEFDFVFQEAKKVVLPELIVFYRKNEKGFARLGLALSKKSIHKAHDRNRIKRLLRETFRIRQLPGFDIVVISRLGVAKVQNAILIAKLSKVWDKLSAIVER